MRVHSKFNNRSTAEDVLKGIDLDGKTMLVTGCNSGIGFETMRVLSKQGARVIGLARSYESAKEACSKVPNAVAVACDLSDFASIDAAIHSIHGLGYRLDSIVANAGIANIPELRTKYGVELQFLVNHLGHFELINGLLDMVPDGDGRVVIVSSSASTQFAPPEGIMFDNLNGAKFYKPLVFYGQSKLANALYAKELSQRLRPRGIAVNSLHPGAIGGTNLNRNLKFPMPIILAVAKLFMKSVPQGAATQCLLAASPLTSKISGEYWVDCEIDVGSKHLQDTALMKRLWDVSEQMIATAIPRANR